MRSWWHLASFALVAAACGGGRSEQLASVCLIDDDCGAGNVCTAGQCSTTESASTSARVTGRVVGAPPNVRIERRVDGDETCTQKQGTLVCTLSLGSRLVLIAPEVEGHRFVSWSGAEACTGSDPELELARVAGDLECTANYVRRFVVSGAIEGEVDGSIAASTESEFASCEGSQCIVDQGTMVTLVAPERDGFRIAGFTGDGCEQQEGYRVVVAAEQSDVLCTASYVESLTVRGQLQGVAPDALAASDAQVLASSTAERALCQGQLCAVDPGASVTLLAPDVEGYRFRGWIGHPSCASAALEVVLSAVDTNIVCSADYVRRYRVRGESDGAEAAIIASADSGFPSCAGETCEVDESSTVTLRAGSVRGFRLRSWSGEGCEGASGSAASAPDVREDRVCTAHFAEGVAVSGTVVNAAGEVVASSSSPGASCEPGRCAIDSGGSVTLTAPTLSGRTFIGWSGDPGCTGTTPTLTLTNVAESKDCRATFAPRYTAEGRPAPANAGSVLASSNTRTARCSANSCEVDEAGAVVLTASAAPDFRFTGWSGGGACSGSAARLELRDLRGNVVCNANFVRRIQVSGAAQPSDGATVLATSLSAGAQCSGASCTVDSGSNVLLTAREAAGYRFVRWSGCGAGSLLNVNPLLLSAPTTDQRCTATLERSAYTVTVRSGAGGNASVRSGSCSGTSCTVLDGASATFSVDPDDGYTFSGWSGDCSGSTGEFTISPVRANATCSASFAQRPSVTISGSASPPLAGTISARSTTAGSACSGASCTVSYGGSVTLEAGENGGFRFLNWSGCSGQASGRTITITNAMAAQSCRANYETLSYIVRGVPSPTAGGRVSCESGCSVDHGVTASLSATANPGYRFTGWSGSGCPSSSNATITLERVTMALTCTASFAREYTVTVRAVDDRGTVSCGGGGTTCRVAPGASIEIRAMAKPTLVFDHWTCAARAPRSPSTWVDSVQSDVPCDAVFVPELI